MQTIARNHTRKMAAAFDAIETCTAYSLDGGFQGRDCPVSVARETLDKFSFAKMVDNEDGTYVVRVHSNLWYELS